MSVTVEYCVWTQVSRSIPWLPTPPGLPQPGRGLVVGQRHLPQLQRDFSGSFRRVLTFLKTTENGEGGKDNTALSEPLSAPTSPWSSPFPPHFPKTDPRYFKSQKGPRGNSRESVRRRLRRVTAPRQRSTGRCSPSRPPAQASQNNTAGGLLPTASVRIRKESSRAVSTDVRVRGQEYRRVPSR